MTVKVPPTWLQVPLTEICLPNRPRHKPQDYPDLPFVGMEHVEAHTMRLLGTAPSATMRSSAVHFYPKDVLYGRLRPYLNKVHRAEFEGLCSGEFIVFPRDRGLSQAYPQYVLNSSAFVSFAAHLNEGDRPRVDFSQIGRYTFPLPPLPEQKRIVAKLEELFSDLDAGVETLKKLRTLIKRYRQSVLKAAFEGKLTEEWREQHKHELEPASVLLERIREERKKKAKEEGKKYTEPPPVDTTNLPELPEGWEWGNLDTLGTWMGGGTPSKKEHAFWSQGSIPWITPKDMKSWWISDSLDKITDRAVQSSAASIVPPDSLLFVVRSGILRNNLARRRKPCCGSHKPRLEGSHARSRPPCRLHALLRHFSPARDSACVLKKRYNG